MNALINFGFGYHDPRRTQGKQQLQPFQGGYGLPFHPMFQAPSPTQMPQQNAFMPLMNYGRMVQRY